MGAPEVTRFLTSLAVESRVASSTQNLVLNALLFIYRVVLEQDLPWLDDVVRAKRPQRLPVVLTRDEVRALLGRLDGTPKIMALLLYGAGLRLLECAELRVKDVDFGRHLIVIRSGKGAKDRVTMLPAAVRPGLLQHLESVRRQHQLDLQHGAGWVELPYALRQSIPTPAANGVGSGCSRPPAVTSIASLASAVAITYTSPSSSALSSAPSATRASRSPRAATRSVTRSQRTCWKTATTSVRCRSCSAIATSRPR